MQASNSRYIIYFVTGLSLGCYLGSLFQTNLFIDFSYYETTRLLYLLLYLLIYGIIVGGLTLLLARGLKLIFIEEKQKPLINILNKLAKNKSPFS